MSALCVPVAPDPVEFDGIGGAILVPLPAPYPTTALPGTPEKVRVLAERALAGCELFHPTDAVFGAGCLPGPRRGGALARRRLAVR